MIHKLIRRSKQGLEQLSLWADGNCVHSVRIRMWELGTKSEKKSHGRPDKAEAALKSLVAEMLREGFEYRDGAPPANGPAPVARPSKARPHETPSWLDHRALGAQRKRLASLVKKAGISHRLGELEAVSKPGISFSLKKVSSAPKGVSRVGGAPEVSPPRGLHFVAQVSLADVHALDLEGVLPAKGLLSFFAQLDETRDDYADVAKVVLSTKLVSVTEAPSRIARIGLLTPRLILTLPSVEDPAIEKLELTQDEREAFHDAVYLELMPDEPAHLLLGHGSAGTEHSLEGRAFLAQFASDERVGFNEGDDQTLRFFFKGKKPELGSVVCTLEEA
ncbi:MAG: DUF1963 domain-containing protein [Archangiaceae bacterium]|nr:DUF1963 domain-containing protein [Archangiaceae bacterium]